MRNDKLVGVLVAVIAAAGCKGGNEQPAASAAKTSTEPGAKASDPAKPAAAPAAPAAAPAKQLITITTKSPDAKAALLAAWHLDFDQGDEALALCKKAVAADADFALGHTCIGDYTPGAAGQAEHDQGAKLAATLPEAERLVAEGAAAGHRGDIPTRLADAKRVAELAPDDFHAHADYGLMLFTQRDYPGASAAFKKVIELEPKMPSAYTALTAIQTETGDFDGAVETAKKFVAAFPAEGHAHSVLGFALVVDNKVKDAEPEIAKSVELRPNQNGYFDLAAIKALAGDFAASRDAIEKAKATDKLPTDPGARADLVVWTLFGEGKTADAAKALDAAEKAADAAKTPWPGNEAAIRAWTYWAMGKSADAIKAADAGLGRCDKPESSQVYKDGCRRELLIVKALAQVEGGAAADAQKTVADLKALDKNGGGGDRLNSEMLSDLVTAVANKDEKGVVAVLAKAPTGDEHFRLAVLLQAQHAKDKVGADQARKALLDHPSLDITYPFFAKAAKGA